MNTPTCTCTCGRCLYIDGEWREEYCPIMSCEKYCWKCGDELLPEGVARNKREQVEWFIAQQGHTPTLLTCPYCQYEFDAFDGTDSWAHMENSYADCPSCNKEMEVNAYVMFVFDVSKYNDEDEENADVNL